MNLNPLKLSGFLSRASHSVFIPGVKESSWMTRRVVARPYGSAIDSQALSSEQMKALLSMELHAHRTPSAISRRKWAAPVRLTAAQASRDCTLSMSFGLFGSALKRCQWMNFSSSVKSIEIQKGFNPLGGKLVRPKSIRKALLQHQFAIVAGPGYTGKTEQIDLAVPDRTSINIKSEYLRDKFHEKIPDEAWDHYDQYKEGEKNWLEQKLDHLMETFGADGSDTVAIDEADYCGINSEVLLKLIEGLRDRGKQVVLILHPEGLQNHDFFSALDLSGIYQNPDEQLIQTGWYTEEEELSLLSTAGYELEEARKIMDQVKGNPIAYIEILKSAQRGTLRSELRLPADKFLQKAKNNTEKMIDISIRSRDFSTAIKLITSSLQFANEPGIPSRVNGLFLMLQEDQQRWSSILVQILLRGDGLPVDLNKRGLIDHWMGGTKHLDQIHRCLEVAASVGVKTMLLRCSQGIVNLVGNHDQVNLLQVRVLGKINLEISNVPLMTEARLPLGSRHWWALHSNSATTIDQLRCDAKQAWPMLKSLAEGVANQFPGIFIDAGIGDMYALKGANRMQEKVDLYMKTGLTEEEAVRQLTDSVRLSIVISKECTATYGDVAQALTKAFSDNPNVHFHICMNKFENSSPKSNPTAYGAVHFVAVLVNPDGSRVFAELQIHKKDFWEVKNGVVHSLYEKTRAPGTSKETKKNGERAQQLICSTKHFESLSLSDQQMVKHEISGGGGSLQMGLPERKVS